MTSGIMGHAHFEELCALASIGQISLYEYQELSDHFAECPGCRDTYSELLILTHAQLPLVAVATSPVPKPLGILESLTTPDYKARFLARGKERGLQLSGDQVQPARESAGDSASRLPQFSYQTALAMAISALLIVTWVQLRQRMTVESRTRAMAAQVENLSNENSALREQVEALSRGKQKIEADLQETRSSSTDLTAEVRGLEDQLKADNLAVETSQAQLTAARDQTAQAEQKMRNARESLVAVNQDLAKLRASRSDDDATNTAERVEIAELSSRAKDQQDIIDKQQQLLAVDEDVRNLMAARSLHITDVFDVDGQGKRKTSFGRVFYTEGKSLVFYAFDLEGPKAPSGKHSFQAWAQLEGSTNSAVNLGIFYVDDPSQKRWMLKFDNPEVLAQISAVFVTAEPHGGAAHPTGQKLMYAYLGHAPNHP